MNSDKRYTVENISLHINDAVTNLTAAIDSDAKGLTIREAYTIGIDIASSITKLNNANQSIRHIVNPLD